MSDTQMSGSQPTKEEQALQQPTDAVPMKTMDKKENIKDQTEAGPSIPAKDENIAPSAATTAAESLSKAKGKEKEESHAPADKQQPEEDHLKIEPTDPPAASHPHESHVCQITLLLPTGARHPYRIDEKYLTKRNVEIPDLTESGEKDVFSISVYKLKELILREWREEWENKPGNPSSIRLIHFGKLLDDKEQLKKYQFSPDSPNVVHMSVRPAEMVEEDEAAKGKSSGREGRNREGGGGGCCIIL